MHSNVKIDDLLLGMVNRLLGNTPEKRLTQLEEQIADLEEQLKEAKQERNFVPLLLPYWFITKYPFVTTHVNSSD